MTDLDFAAAMVQTARAHDLPSDPDSAFVDGIRALFNSNYSMFTNLGFDPETARFLACALAAREMNFNGAVGRC